MASVKGMVGRLGLLLATLALCGLKYLYTLTIEIHSTGAEAFYVLLLHDVWVVVTAWTVLLALLVINTGAASIDSMGSLKFLHGSYALVMTIVALYSLFNDAFAMGGAVGAHNWILLTQFALELFVVVFMGQQFWAIAKSLGTRAMEAAQRQF